MILSLQVILAAIIVFALKDMVAQVLDLKPLWSQSLYDWVCIISHYPKKSNIYTFRPSKKEKKNNGGKRCFLSLSAFSDFFCDFFVIFTCLLTYFA